MLTKQGVGDQTPAGKGDDKDSVKELKRVVKDIERMAEANLNMYKVLWRHAYPDQELSPFRSAR